MHGEVLNNSTDTSTAQTPNSQVRSIKTRIWRHARTSNGYFLDVSKISNLTDQQHLIQIDKQYKASSFTGVKFLGKNKQRYIEIYPNEEIEQRFLTEGVLYDLGSSKVQLFPCKSVNGEGKLIQVNLTDIPFFHKDQLLHDLKEVMGHFGTLLDIGLNYEQPMGWFMGSDYAIIQQLLGEVYPKLSHTITWTNGSDNEFCHAPFPDMPIWCRYCHDEGHTKFEYRPTVTDPRGVPVLGNTRNLAPDNSKEQEVGESTQQTAQDQQHQQHQQTQQEQIALEESTTEASQPSPPGDQAEINLAQDNANLQDLDAAIKDQNLEDEENDGDDDEYMPSASEEESIIEDMRDLESDKDEVANFHQQQQQEVNIFTYGAVYSDSNTQTPPNSAYSSNYNESTANH